MPGDEDDADGVGGALDVMSPLCPLDDEHLPLVVDSLKGKQVDTQQSASQRFTFAA